MKDEWVRVKSEDELRAGMAVQIRNCRWCGRRETVILTARTPGSVLAVGPGGQIEDPSSAFGWIQAGACMAKARARSLPGTLMGGAVREGRVFRLADSELTDLSESRELENVR